VTDVGRELGGKRNTFISFCASFRFHGADAMGKDGKRERWPAYLTAHWAPVAKYGGCSAFCCFIFKNKWRHGCQARLEAKRKQKDSLSLIRCLCWLEELWLFVFVKVSICFDICWTLSCRKTREIVLMSIGCFMSCITHHVMYYAYKLKRGSHHVGQRSGMTEFPIASNG